MIGAKTVVISDPPRSVVVLEPGMIPKTPSGKLRRAHTMALVS
ncbi:MAG TPA: hypothetical protein VGC05_04930 [Mycobacterium sp.]